ncbi:hypothetical protein DTL70_08870 [Streptomyces diacarni]|uniref:Uncharacterized protein n=1 Tax=Streptomyces diacarni TaxID=2800381 RepID=A0A367F6Y5_9ACTN|nr:hypothetical protein DTL70_08870 [Streptomyces diacarni]
MCLRHQPPPQLLMEAAAAIGSVPNSTIMTARRMYSMIPWMMAAMSIRNARIRYRKAGMPSDDVHIELIIWFSIANPYR